jgi:hypothetical protein
MNKCSQPMQVDNKIILIIINANSKVQITESSAMQISKPVTEDGMHQRNLTEKAVYELCRSHHMMAEMRQTEGSVYELYRSP